MGESNALDEIEFLKAADGALKTLYRSDASIIKTSTDERAAAHRLAVYLEPSFSGMDVDCDYNPFGEGPGHEALPGIQDCNDQKGADWLVPDILVHERRTDGGEKLAVFEVRVETALDDCDRLKLEGMTSKPSLAAVLSLTTPWQEITSSWWSPEIRSRSSGATAFRGAASWTIPLALRKRTKLMPPSTLTSCTHPSRWTSSPTFSFRSARESGFCIDGGSEQRG